MTSATLKTTPLHEEHQRLAAKMVDFAGWSMPIQYPTGINQEHLAVRDSVGMFDVSHMGELRISGAGALEFLRFATLNDPAKLSAGRGQYTMISNDQGGLVDDAYLYQLAEQEFLLICNAAGDDLVNEHLQTLAQDYDVSLERESAAWGLVALQGPHAKNTLQPLVKTDLGELKKNRIIATKLTKTQVDMQVARTGYTGEDGFEILVAAEHTAALWRALEQAGAVPCGLGARDTLRLEAGFPLFGHDFTHTTNPRCSNYGWVIKDKPFFGRDNLWDVSCQTYLVGLELQGKGVPREGYEVVADGSVIGHLTSGTLSPLTKKGIALARIEASYKEPGQLVSVRVRGKDITASVVKPPFY
jgi:aminomethyltransferase